MVAVDPTAIDVPEPTVAPAVVEGRPVRPRRPGPALTVAGLAVAGAVLLPAVYLLVRARDAGWDRVADLVLSERTAELVVQTGLLVVGVTAATVVLGVPLAWLTTRTDLPARRVWTVLLAMPLAVPSYVGGFAFVAFLGPRGTLQQWLEPLGVDRLPSIYGYWGAWALLTLIAYPYVLLTTRAALLRLDPSLEEASRSLGRGGRTTFARVVLAQLRPAAAAGGLLVALYTLHDFGAVSLLQYESFTQAIFVQYRASLDRSAAAVLSLVLVAISVLVVAAEGRLRGRAVYYRTHGAARPAPVVRLGRWRWPATAACGLLVAVALGLPVGVAIGWLVSGLREGVPLGPVVEAAIRSIRASFLGALVAVAAAWPVARLAVRHPGVLSRFVERSSFVGFALPGIVVALSLVFFGARVVPELYQTLWLLVFAYVVLFLPQASGAMRASLLQVSPSLEDASRSLGAGPIATARRVVLPLVRPGLLAGFALVFLTCMKELPATLLLAPTGYSTLASETWAATADAFYGEAAAPALALVLLSSLPLALLVLRESSRAGGPAA